MNKLSIGIKIAIGFVIILIMFIIVSIVTIQNTKRLHDAAVHVDHTYNVLEKIEKVSSDLKDAEIGQRGYLITGMQNYLEPYNAALGALQEDMDSLQKVTTNPYLQSRINELRSLVTDKLAELKQTINLRRNTGFEAALEMVLTDSGKNTMDDIRVVLSDMTNEENRLLEERNPVIEKSSDSANATVIWITIAACVIVILLIIYFTRIIAFPIRKLSAIAERIASGDLTGKVIETNRKDEIGIMVKSFDLMNKSVLDMTRLSEKIADGDLTVKITPRSEKDSLGKALATMAKNFKKQINDIREGINVLSSSTSEIMASVSQLASGSAETATSVNETTSTIEEIKQTAEVSNQKATEVADSAQKISLISQDGKKSVQETIEGMNKIKKQMESIAGIVVRLSDQSQSIGEIASSVNDLAEQSNLLAVNAAIEAAKAGEQGKGFVVVAQEIKNLAERSKESTIQIRNILSDIQKAISSAVMATEQGGKVIDEGLELSSTSSEVITTLATSVEQASQANLQIAASSQQQVVGMDQVTSAMESIKEASLQTAASTKQAESSVTDLHKLGEKLQDILKQYKLK
jgi:methyl-accepting chemotaxis protein